MSPFRLVSVLASAAFTVVVASCGGDSADPVATGSAASAPGEWKTWVLSSGSEIDVPAPPAPGSPEAERDARRLSEAVESRTAGDETVVARWDRAPAMEPWMRDAMEFVGQRPKDPPYSSRAYGLVAVAMYDAAISAAYWQERYGREAPAEESLVEASAESSYPSEHAAMAGAASGVLAYLFPEAPAAQLRQDAREAARSRVDAGVAYPSDAAAGLALGRRVAARAIAHAKRDGSTRAWDGRRPPHTPAFWDPPPGSAANPVQPVAGSWGTWVLQSGDQFRAPPPPKFGSARFDKGIDRMIEAKDELTPRQRELALFWAGGDGTALPAGIWEGVVLNYLRDRDLSTYESARVLALVSVAMADAGVAAWDTKYAYWNPRPETAIRNAGVEPGWKPLIPTPFFPAYVSGHATYSAAAAKVLSHLFPEETKAWEQRASQAAKSRIWGGIHWPYDSSEGLVIGRQVGDLVVERAKGDGAEQ